MRLAPKAKAAAWEIVPPADPITARFPHKMEEQYKNGYIVNTVSHPELLLKHLLYEAYKRSQVVGAGDYPAHTVGDAASPEQVYQQFKAGKEGSRCGFEYLDGREGNQTSTGLHPT